MTKEINVILAFKQVNKNSHLYSKIVSAWTRSSFYHVEIIIDNKWISSSEGTGTTIRDLKPLKNTWVYHDLGTVTLMQQQYDFILNWITQQANKKYDWLGIALSQALPVRFHDNSKWFCSEIVTKILQMFLFKEVIDLEPNLVSPGDLSRAFHIE